MLTKSAVYFIALAVGFPVAAAKQATCVATYESARNPLAINDKNSNGSRDIGLMQINDMWEDTLCKDLALFDPFDNMECALRLYNDADSWKPWYAFRKHRTECSLTEPEIKGKAPIIDDRVICEHAPEIPQKVIFQAQATCNAKYKKCLKKLIRTSVNSYHAICGVFNEEKSEAIQPR